MLFMVEISMNLEREVQKHLDKWYAHNPSPFPYATRIGLNERDIYNAQEHYKFFSTGRGWHQSRHQYVKKIYDVIKENITLGLVSPSSYVREWTKLIYAEQSDTKQSS